MKAAACVIALLLCSCKVEKSWRVEYVPTTDAERSMIKEHVEKIVSGLRLSHVSGDDQDLEDVIIEAHFQARRSFCRPTLWETDMNGSQTGNWKYCNDKEKQP